MSSFKVTIIFMSLLYGVKSFETKFLDGDIDLTDGVRLVSIPIDSNFVSGRGLDNEGSTLYKMAKFLQGHELHVKLPNIVEKEKLLDVLNESLKTIDETNKDMQVTGRKKGGGGGGGIALLGLMMMKSLGAAGIGGLALLTMKALMVSALALLLSAVVGAKKLTSHDDHEGGHEVHHVTAHEHGHGHYRRRRDTGSEETPLPYRGWTKYQQSSY